MWVRLGLIGCNIQAKAKYSKSWITPLYDSSDIIIDELWLENNNLKTITIVFSDHQLCSMFMDPSDILEQLYLQFTSLSGRSDVDLFIALKSNLKLKSITSTMMHAVPLLQH